MPWKVEKTDRCPAAKPWGVIKKANGAVVGCHPSKKAAQKQVAALHANEGKSMSDDSRREQVWKVEGLQRVHRDGIRAMAPAIQLRSQADTGSPPVMVGHFSVFNEWTHIKSVWEGDFMERFAPGSFKRTIKNNREKMRVLFQHGMDPQVGDKPLGPIDQLAEDSIGPAFEVPLLDAGYVRDQVLPGLEAGLYGVSHRFRVMREDIVEEPGVSDHNPQGLQERTITEAQVMEFGPVTFPAYTGADVGIRSLTDEFLMRALAQDKDRFLELLRDPMRMDTTDICTLAHMLMCATKYIEEQDEDDDPTNLETMKTIEGQIIDLLGVEAAETEPSEPDEPDGDAPDEYLSDTPSGQTPEAREPKEEVPKRMGPRPRLTPSQEHTLNPKKGWQLP